MVLGGGVALEFDGGKVVLVGGIEANLFFGVMRVGDLTCNAESPAVDEERFMKSVLALFCRAAASFNQSVTRASGARSVPLPLTSIVSLSG